MSWNLKNGLSFGVLFLKSFKMAKDLNPLDMPDSDLFVREKAVLDAIASGDIPPDVGSSLIQSINSTVRTMELIDLEQRLSILESDLK